MAMGGADAGAGVAEVADAAPVNPYAATAEAVSVEDLLGEEKKEDSVDAEIVA